jgi:hypothetical protein
MTQSTEIIAPDPIQLREVTTLLLKHYGLHEGLWDLNLELQMGIGQFGQTREKALPGAMVTVSRIGVSRTPAENAGPNTVNAAEANPVS